MIRSTFILLVTSSSLCSVAAGGPLPGGTAPSDTSPSAATPLEAPPVRAASGIVRVQMPTERIESWIRASGVKYLRVPAEQFERLVAAHGDGGDGGQGETYLRAVRLSAKLMDDDTLVGNAVLDVHHLGDGPTFLPLAPCTLALRETDDPNGGRSFARWTGKPARRAMLGPAEDGRLGVLVERSGALEIAWSLRGRRSTRRAGSDAKLEGNGLAFRWEMPPATVCVLELDLPARWVPRLDRGVVESLAEPAPQRKRWRIRLPATTTRALSLEDGSNPTPRADVTLRHAQTYRVFPHGIDLQSDLSLDVAGGPLHELDLDLSPGLVLLAASTGAEQRVSWSLSGTAEAPRVRLHFPHPLGGSKQSVRLEATAPLRLDRPFVLPGVAPRQVLWQEGLSTIWIAKSLSLESALARGGIQSSGIRPQNFERLLGSQLAFRLLGPEASIEMVVTRLRPRLEVSQATSLTWGPSELRGRTIAEVTCLEGECFDVWAEVGVPWTVEMVEAAPDDLLADWERERAVDPSVAAARVANPRAAQFVHVRLAKPIRAGETARLALMGRHLSSGSTSASAPLRWDDLEMLTFPEARSRQRWLSVESTAGTVRLGHATGVREVSGSDLTLAQRPLFDHPPQGLILAVDAVTPQVEVVAERSRASAPAKARVETVRDVTAPAAANDSVDSESAGAIVRTARLESRYELWGQARHHAAFEIENHALSAARLLLPDDAEQIEVRVDGTLAAQADTADPMSVALSRGRRTIHVDYTTTFSGLRVFTTVEARMPHWQSGVADLPVLDRVWTIGLPQGYEVFSIPGWQARDSRGMSWAERLFGPLARVPDERLPDSPDALAGGTGVVPARQAGSPPDGAVWHTRTYLGAAESSLRARLVQRSTFDAVGWALFLAVAVGIWCFGPPWGKAVGIAAAILLTGTLLAPEFCAASAAGALWGLGAGLVMKTLLARKREPSVLDASSGPQERAVSFGSPKATLGVIWLVCIVGHASHGSYARGEPAWPVIVPSDAVAGSDDSKLVCVPEILWERLRQRPIGAGSQPSWIIERADYVGRLSSPVAGGGVSAASLTATLSVRTALNPTRVRLDFGSSLGTFRPLEAILDGQLVSLSWDAAARVCTVEVPQAGMHALELPLRASVRADGSSWQLEHPVPPVSVAQVSLALPAAEVATAELVSALGAASQSGRLLRGDLGAADRIVVRWQDNVAAQPPRIDVDELLWLRVKTGAVSLRAKWVCEARRGQVRQFRVAADQGLRLNGDFRDGDGIKIRHEEEVLPPPRTTVGPHVFMLTLDPPRSGRFTIECDFVVEDTHGIGRLRYPYLSGGETPLDRQRLAVSVDANLRYEELGFKGSSAGAVGKFLDVWGDSDGRPDFVRSANDVGPQWSLRLRPHEVDRAVQQTLWADFGPRRADLTWEANVTCTGGPCFQHRLLVPSEFVAEHLTVSEGGQVRDAVWTATPGIVNVFLRERAAGSQRLRLRGHLPISASGAVTVPAIHLDQAVTTSAETRLSRQSAVRAARVSSEPPKTNQKTEAGSPAAKGLVPTNPVPLAAPAASVSEQAGSRSLGAFATPPGTRLQLDLQPNRPNVRSPVLITTLRREGEQWLAGVEYDALVTDVLDAVTFSGPAGLGVPTVLRPEGRVDRQSVGGQTRWHFVPKAELGGRCRISLSWHLAPPTGQRLELPAIDVLTTSPVPRFVAVSKELAAASDRWKPADLVAIKAWDEVLAASGTVEARDLLLDERLTKLREDLASYELFRAPEPGASIVIHRSTVYDTAVAARATVDWQAPSDLTYHGLATFTWPAGGPASVKFRLPEGSRWLCSTWWAAPPADDKPARAQPALAARTEDGLWQVSFGPQTLPRTFEVQFAGSQRSSLIGLCDLPSVELVDAPLEETVWTVTLPVGRSVETPSEAESRVIDGRQVISRTVPGSESQALRLIINATSHDSFWRRSLILAALLVIGAGLAWCVAFGRVDPRLLVWLSAPLGLAWWMWLRPSGVGLAIAAASVLLGLCGAARIGAERRRTLQPPPGPPAHEGVSGDSVRG